MPEAQSNTTSFDLTADEIRRRVLYERRTFGSQLSYSDQCETYGTLCWTHGRAKIGCNSSCTYHVDTDEIRRRLAALLTEDPDAMTYHAGMQFLCGPPFEGRIGLLQSINFATGKIDLEVDEDDESGDSFVVMPRKNVRLVNHDPCCVVGCTASNETEANT